MAAELSNLPVVEQGATTALLPGTQMSPYGRKRPFEHALRSYLDCAVRARRQGLLFQVGAQRIVSEVRFPQPRCQLVDVGVGMGGDALQDIGEIDGRVDVVQTAGGQQTL